MTMTITPTETEQAPLPAWSIHWRGQVFRESDLTGRHLSVLALINGKDDFDTLDMNPTLGHQRLMMVLSTFLAVEATANTSDPDEAADAIVQVMSLVASATAEEILGSIRFE